MNLASVLKSLTAATRYVAPGDTYSRTQRGNLVRTDLRGQLRRERRRDEISARQQRIAIKASRRGGVA